jgi:hypothetical protein
MKTKLSQETKNHLVRPVHRLYVAGTGSHWGSLATCAWVNEDAKKKGVKVMQGLSTLEVEYQSVLAAIESVPDGAIVVILCSSRDLCQRVDEGRSVPRYESRWLLSRLHRISHARRLEVTVRLIHPDRNPAIELADLSGVNYFFGLTTTISPDQRQLLLARRPRAKPRGRPGFAS